MSIYKHQQIYGRTFRRWLRGFFLRTLCDSYLQPPRPNNSGLLNRVLCDKHMGHNSRHSGVDVHGQILGLPGEKVTWGIGDNLV